MTVTIYVEGGGKNSAAVIRCWQGFARYCQKLAPRGRWPKIVACGGREEAFDRFKTDISSNRSDNLCVLLVDAEGPVGPNTSPFDYLRQRDRWNFPPLGHHRAFLMVQAMEAWFLADRRTLAEYYGADFRLNALPGDERHVEMIPKDDLEQALIRASAATRTKGQYHKTRHAFALLEMIDPDKVKAGSPHAAAFHHFLRTL